MEAPLEVVDKYQIVGKNTYNCYMIIDQFTVNTYTVHYGHTVFLIGFGCFALP